MELMARSQASLSRVEKKSFSTAYVKLDMIKPIKATLTQSQIFFADCVDQFHRCLVVLGEPLRNSLCIIEHFLTATYAVADIQTMILFYDNGLFQLDPSDRIIKLQNIYITNCCRIGGNFIFY